MPKSPRRRTSGPTQPEADRKRGQLLLRLPGPVVAALRERAALEGCTISALVERALAAYAGSSGS